MTALEAALRAAIGHLNRLDVQFALVGGFAVSAYATPRIPPDVDFAVAVAGDAPAEALVRELRGNGYVLQGMVEHTRTGRLGTARLIGPAGIPVALDLLFASSGIEPEIAARARPIELIPDLFAPVATPGDLVALKLLARDDATRPQDPFDLIALRSVLDEADVAIANAAVRLITERGYNRDRDLPELLNAYLSDRPGAR